MEFISFDEIVDVLPGTIQYSTRFRSAYDANLNESAEVLK